MKKRILIVNKKGSQIGMVLSFTLFVVSLLFLYIFFRPLIQVNESKIDELEFLEKSIMLEISEEIYIVNLNNLGSPCSYIENPKKINSSFDVIGFREDGSKFDVFIGSGATYFSGNTYFSKLYYFSSPIFQTQDSSLSSCEKIEIKSVEIENIILESKIKDLINLNKENYDLLKKNLSINFDSDFDISFFDSSGEFTGKENKVLRTNIYSRERMIEYYDSEGIKKDGKLVIKIW